MAEYMLLIRNEADSKSSFSAEKDREFLEACRVYIEQLQKEGRLLRAQPLIREGRIVEGAPGAFREAPYDHYREGASGKEVIVGYYHVIARDIEEAVEIAKGNPEFSFTSTARVEIRPIKGKEQSTTYTYPKG